jgi:IS1 family transposase
MTSSWAFPPSTTKLQLDEKWSFVHTKQKNVDEHNLQDYLRKGDQWDFVAFDPDNRLVLSVLVGKRLAENAEYLLEDVKQRLGGRTPVLITTDELSAYEEVIRKVFGQQVIPPHTGKPGRPAGPRREVPAGLHYATVHKTRKKGRVVQVEQRLIFGSKEGLAKVLDGAAVSTSYLERQHSTDRHRNARKGRKTLRFSKDWDAHEAMTFFSLYSYNFCWPVRTLKLRPQPDGPYQQRTPAMAAGLADHVWSLKEWVTFPAFRRRIVA